MNEAPPPGVVGLLTAQAFAFGVTLALLLVAGNSLFLDAYGSQWLPVDLHRDRGRGQRSRRADRPRDTDDPPHPRRHGHASAPSPRSSRRRGRSSSPGATGRRGRSSSRSRIAHPDRLRLPRRAGRPAARRAPDEGALSASRVGVRGGLPGRRRHPDPVAGAARIDREPVARDDRGAARVPGTPAVHRTPLPGGESRAGRRRAGRRPAAAAEAVHRPPGAPARLSGAVGDGIAGGRFPALRSGRGALHRRRPDALSVAVHGAAQPRRHRLPRRAGRPADAPVRPPPRADPQSRDRGRDPRGHGARRCRRRRGVVRACSPWPAFCASPTSRRPTERRAHRSTPRTRWSQPTSGSRCRRSSRASESRWRSVPPACFCSSSTRSTSAWGR